MNLNNVDKEYLRYICQWPQKIITITRDPSNIRFDTVSRFNDIGPAEQQSLAWEIPDDEWLKIVLKWPEYARITPRVAPR